MIRVSFRRAVESDSEFVYQTKKTVLKKYVDMVWGWREEEQRVFHEERFTTQSIRVIQFDELDVGVLSYRLELDCLDLYQLFILPEHQRTGIGTFCIEWLLEEASKRFIPVRLRCMKVNTGGLLFWEKLGFNVISEDENYIYFEKSRYDKKIC